MRTKKGILYAVILKGKTLIRANQGHSIPVDVELSETDPPAENAGCDFMYIDEFRKCEATEVSEKDFEKKKKLFLDQKKTLDSFLKTGAISRMQYDKSYGDLVRKMGMENVAEEISEAEK